MSPTQPLEPIERDRPRRGRPASRSGPATKSRRCCSKASPRSPAMTPTKSRLPQSIHRRQLRAPARVRAYVKLGGRDRCNQMRGVPIKLTYSREEDFAHDFPRHISMSRARGVVARRTRSKRSISHIASPSVLASQMSAGGTVRARARHANRRRRLGQPIRAPALPHAGLSRAGAGAGVLLARGRGANGGLFLRQFPRRADPRGGRRPDGRSASA